MTIDQAIYILSESAYHGTTTHNTHFKEALKLAIKALIEKQRRDTGG